ncbi:MAG: SurA N-terminal domain-containing protein [Syntrophales bacterium]|nr:SurA N-terminal domain-containing protein [Syntrophales bacterium]
MLNIMRRHARNWLMKLVLGIIIVVFIFYFGSMSGRNKAERIAMLDGKPIVYVDFQKEYQNLLDMYREQLGRSLTEEMLKGLNLKKQAFDILINQEVLLKKAEDLEIHISNEEVKNAILSYPAFQQNGVFDNIIYEQTIRAAKMTTEQFEDSQRKILLSAQVESLIKDGVKLADEDVLDFYRMQKEKLNLDYIRISPADFLSVLKPSQTELEDFLKANQGKFRVPEQVQIKYVAFMPQDFAATVVPSETEIADYYEKHRELYKKNDKIIPLADVRDRVSGDIRQGAGRKAAYDEAKKAHDTIYQQENFDAYAAQKKLAVHTTDFSAISAPPQEFKAIDQWGKIVSSLKDGEISRVLQGENGYYIIRIAARKAPYVPALKDIAAAVEKQYREVEAGKLAQKEAEKISTRLKKGEGLDALAKGRGLMVLETGFFQPGGAIPKIGSSAELTESLFQLSSKKPSPEKAFLIDGNYIVIALRERSKADDSDFASQKDAVAKYLSQAEKTEAFRQWLEGSKAELVKQGRLKFVRDFKDL